MQIERNNAGDLAVNELPDGSRVIVDSKNEKVFALNATAGAAWDACSGPTTLSGVTEQMRRSLEPGITDEIAEEAVLRLQEQNLVTASGFAPKTTRRQVLATMGAVALPLVVSMTLADQKAYADRARSGPATPPPTPDSLSDRPVAHVSHETDVKL